MTLVAPTPASEPSVSRMAVASLALSFLAFILPLGIASVVMGHMSRSRIAKSGGRERGRGFAFAGLIISYMQFGFVALFCLALVPVWNEMTRDFDRNPDLRAALLARMMNGDPDHPSAAALEQQRKDLMDALHLIRARESSYHDSHGEGYLCPLYNLTNDDEELNFNVMHSHTEIQVNCRDINPTDASAHGYVATTVPRDENPAKASIYCLDQTEVIRKYGNDRIADVKARTFMQHEPCPQDGEPVN